MLEISGTEEALIHRLIRSRNRAVTQLKIAIDGGESLPKKLLSIYWLIKIDDLHEALNLIKATELANLACWRV